MNLVNNSVTEVEMRDGGKTIKPALRHDHFDHFALHVEADVATLTEPGAHVLYRGFNFIPYVCATQMVICSDTYLREALSISRRSIYVLCYVTMRSVKLGDLEGAPLLVCMREGNTNNRPIIT